MDKSENKSENKFHEGDKVKIIRPIPYDGKIGTVRSYSRILDAYGVDVPGQGVHIYKEENLAHAEEPDADEHITPEDLVEMIFSADNPVDVPDDNSPSDWDLFKRLTDLFSIGILTQDRELIQQMFYTTDLYDIPNMYSADEVRDLLNDFDKIKQSRANELKPGKMVKIKNTAIEGKIIPSDVKPLYGVLYNNIVLYTDESNLILISDTKFEIGDRVKIISSELCPEDVGSTGIIEDIKASSLRVSIRDGLISVWVNSTDVVKVEVDA